MTEEEILGAVETILYNAAYPKGIDHLEFYHFVEKKDGGHCEFSNKTVTLLIALYQKLTSDKEKKFLFEIFKQKGKPPLLPIGFRVRSLISKHLDFIFVFHVKIKEIDTAFEMIKNRIVITKSKTDLLVALGEILATEPNIFDAPQLEKILTIVRSFQNFISEKRAYDVKGKSDISLLLYNKGRIPDYEASDSGLIDVCEKLLKIIQDEVYKIKENRLSSFLLEGVNFELNQDQKQVEIVINEFGFNPTLNDTLVKINQEIHEARDKFDFKSCIDFIRVFLNELCISIAVEIQKREGVSPTEPIDSMGRARAYFIDTRVKFLSKEEDDFIGQFNAFISHKGVHSLQSEKEYARISKNLVIELGLFLLERLKKYLSNS